MREGEFLGIIGHTGSGKSTLVQHLNGLFRPSSGQVLLNGHDIWEKPKEIRSVRFQVGMVFQYPEHQLFEETVAKDIAFGPKNMGLPEEEIRSRVQKAADFAGLPKALLEKSPFDLSGGEKRRAAIAGVIAMDPQVLILDEPTAGLDPMGRDDLLEQIAAYHRKRGNTVLLVSHSMQFIFRRFQAGRGRIRRAERRSAFTGFFVFHHKRFPFGRFFAAEFSAGIGYFSGKRQPAVHRRPLCRSFEPTVQTADGIRLQQCRTFLLDL